MNGKEIKITGQQERFLKLLYKFRYVNATELAKVIGIRTDSTYDVLETLKRYGLVTKVYKKEYRIERKPAYYYLSKSGVTLVRKLLNVKESVVHALYKESSDDFIVHCQTVLACYVALGRSFPPDTDIFTKTEINRFGQFPKNRPDLYIRTPDDQEILVLVVNDQPNYIVNKRLDEIIQHSEDEGWPADIYPVIAFILKDKSAQNSFLYKTFHKLEDMGMDEGELRIKATSLPTLSKGEADIWSTPYNLKQGMKILT